MTVSNVTIEKHDKGVGWYKLTIVSLKNFIGETKVEMLLREETLRQLRYHVDQALSKQEQK